MSRKSILAGFLLAIALGAFCFNPLMGVLVSGLSGSGGNTGFEPWYYYVAGLVNSASGNLYFSVRDVSIRARGFDIEIVRAYNSHRNGTCTGFGFGWTFNYHVRLMENGGVVSLVEGDGSVHEFTSIGGGQYSSPPGIHYRLIKNLDGSFTLWFKDGSRYDFDSSGVLLNIVDKNDNHLTFSYTDGKLTRVEDDSGLALVLNYNLENRISSVVDPLGRKIRYEYDADGNLVKVTDAMGYFALYFYDDEHNLKSVVNRFGGTLSFEYSYNKVVEIDASLYNYSTGLSSSSFRIFSIDYGVRNVVVTNARGYETIVQMNEDGNPTQIIDALGGVTSMAWDSNMNMIDFTDANRHTFTYDYDSYGNLLNETDPLSYSTLHEWNNVDLDTQYICLLVNTTNARGFTTRFDYDVKGNSVERADATGNSSHLSYDTHGNVVNSTDFRGHSTLYSYGTYGNIIGSTDATGNITEYTYDIACRLSNITDAYNHTTSYVYDNNDRLIRMIDALGGVIQYFYNEEGSLTKMIDANEHENEYSNNLINKVNQVTDASGNETHYIYDTRGNLVEWTDARGGITSMTYDQLDRITFVRDALGNTEYYRYDAVGNLLRTIDRRGYTTRYEYDALNRVRELVDAVGGETIYDYDAVGNLINRTDANGHSTTYKYDELNRLTKITDALGYNKLFSYDPDGNIIAYIDENGHTTSFEYDALNRRTKSVDTKGNVSLISYDALGNMIGFTDRNGRTTTYTYDALSRLIEVTDVLGHVSTVTYDAVGNVIQVTDARGSTTLYGYDSLNRLMNITNALGYTLFYTYDAVGNPKSRTDPNGDATTYAFDLLNRLIKITDPLGYETHYEYDAVGNRISVIDANGHVTTYEYDCLDRLVKEVDASNNETVYGYDAVGNLISITDANNHTTKYQYDALDRTEKVISPLGYETRYFYDGVGNRIQKIDANGNTIIHTYDALNQLLQTSYPDGNNVTYEYDAVGNIIRISNNGIGLNDIAWYSYDELNRLASVTVDYGSFVKSTVYTYDDVGNLKTATDSEGGITTYEYDATNRLTGVTDPLNDVTTFQYDNAGRRTKTNYANGAYTTYSYDSADRLLNLTNRKSNGDIISSYAYSYDNIGSRLNVKDHNSDLTIYEYDTVYGIIGVTYPSGNTTHYIYDRIGNRLAQISNGDTTSYTYDADDRLLSANAVSYSYDSNGNLICKIEGDRTTYYEYDYENRLTKVILPDASEVIFQYSPVGSRLSKTAGNQTTFYFYSFEDILLELDVNGDLEARYTHGPKTDEPISINRNGNKYYYYHDGLGSIDSLTDFNENVVATYKYDVFGTILNETGTTENFYKFTGREYDEEIGLYYYRSRYYFPEVGRFASQDPLLARRARTEEGINAYVYVKNNPVNVIDPFGLQGILPREQDEHDARGPCGGPGIRALPVTGGYKEGKLISFGKTFTSNEYDFRCVRKLFKEYKERFKEYCRIAEMARKALEKLKKLKEAWRNMKNKAWWDLFTGIVGLVLTITGIITAPASGAWLTAAGTMVNIGGEAFSQSVFGYDKEGLITTGVEEASDKTLTILAETGCKNLGKAIPVLNAVYGYLSTMVSGLNVEIARAQLEEIQEKIRKLRSVNFKKAAVEGARLAWDDFVKKVDKFCRRNKEPAGAFCICPQTPEGRYRPVTRPSEDPVGREPTRLPEEESDGGPVRTGIRNPDGYIETPPYVDPPAGIVIPINATVGNKGFQTLYNVTVKLQIFDLNPENRPILLVVDESDGTYVYYQNALTANSYTYDTVYVDTEYSPVYQDADPATKDLKDYDVVIWECSNDRSGTLQGTAQVELAKYLDNNGCLFLGGEGIMYNWPAKTGTLMSDYMFANGYGTDTYDLSVNGVPKTIGDDFSLSLSGGTGSSLEHYSSSIAGFKPGGKVNFLFDGCPGIAGIQADTGTYRTVLFSFSFDSIASETNRNALMYEILEFLDCRYRHTVYEETQTIPEIPAGQSTPVTFNPIFPEPGDYRGGFICWWPDPEDPDRDDNKPEDNIDETIIKVKKPPYSPIASFIEEPERPHVGQPVTFNASTSQPGFDGDDICDITEYHWDFGDGETDTGKTVTHVYTKPRDYLVTLTVYAPGIGPYIDPQYTGTNTTDTTHHIKTVVVGGHSIPINTPTTTKPLTTYLVLMAIISATLTLTGRMKTRRKPRKSKSR